MTAARGRPVFNEATLKGLYERKHFEEFIVIRVRCVGFCAALSWCSSLVRVFASRHFSPSLLFVFFSILHAILLFSFVFLQMDRLFFRADASMKSEKREKEERKLKNENTRLRW